MTPLKTTTASGILFVSASYFLFTLHDAVIKLLVTHLSVWQIVFFRSLGIFAACMLIGGRGFAGRVISSPIVKPMAVRSLLLLAAWISYYTAAKSLQLAELTTIYYAAPIVATLLAIPMLGEKVPLPRWAAIILGFIGVIVASNPAGLAISLPVGLALLAAVLWASASVLLRKTAMNESTLVQMTLTNGFFVLLTFAMAIYHWQPIDFDSAALQFLVVLLGGAAQASLFEAMRRAPVSVLAPFEYSSLIWAFVLGYVIWLDIPAHNVAIGAGLICCAGLLIVSTERLAARRYRLARPQTPAEASKEDATGA
ncbi:DMT family transporter [Neorhizobium sp. NCHU2750]|uniref:DMT family transporter n=1 Tax=Neorhizobium sp. NCHU2750 TaxID=1825976 RepID=UPI000EB64C66|nr:membrane protein [Neorhizobium sp. NCHU2750]